MCLEGGRLGRRCLTLALKFPRDMFLLVDLVDISEHTLVTWRNTYALPKSPMKRKRDLAMKADAGDTERGSMDLYTTRP